MARKKEIDFQVAGVQFGNWKLVPRDLRSWELFRFRKVESKGTESKSSVKWCTEGRYFDYTGIGHAIQYAADQEIKDKCRDKAMPISEALAEYERITKEFLEAVEGRLLKG